MVCSDCHHHYHREAVATAFLLVAGICLFGAAFDIGGPGVGYLTITIIPLIVCTIAVRCVVAGTNNRSSSSYGYYDDGSGSGGGGDPRWSLFFLGACGTILICLPFTLYRLRLIYPAAFLFAVLGIEIQGIAIAIIAYGGGGASSSRGEDGHF